MRIQQTRRHALQLFLAGLTWLVCPAHAMDLLPYAPMSGGNNWVYSLDCTVPVLGHLTDVQIITSAAEPGGASFTVSGDINRCGSGYTSYKSLTKDGIVLTRDIDAYDGTVTNYAPPFLELPANASVGDVFTRTGSASEGQGAYKVTWTFLGEEPVVVPAGRFKTIKLRSQWEWTIVNPQQGSTLHMSADITYWLAKNVGIVRWRDLMSVDNFATIFNTSEIKLISSNLVETRDAKKDGDSEDCMESCGDPIHHATGNSVQSQVDIAERGPGLRRVYNSRVPPLGVLGRGWRHGYESQLLFLPQANSGQVMLARADGKWLSFTKSGGTWVPDADINVRLVEINSPDSGTSSPSGWLVYDQNNQTEVYDEQGRLNKIVSKEGRALSVDSDPVNGRVTAVTDSFGRRLSLGYRADGQLAWAKDAADRSTLYDYDGALNLKSVTFPDGAVRRYRYNEPQRTGGTNLPNALTSLLDENGAEHVSWTFDASGRATSSQLAGGVDQAKLTYNEDGTVTLKDALASERRITYERVQGVDRPKTLGLPSANAIRGNDTARRYDQRGNVASRDDFRGYRKCYLHEAARNLEQVRVEGLAGGNPGAACADVTAGAAVLPAGSRKTSTQWHPHWRLRTKVAEPGRMVTHVYNGQPDPFNGNAIASCAPATARLPDGKPIAVLCKQIEQATTDVDGSKSFNAALQSGVANRVSTWTYDQYGQVLTEDGPRTDMADITKYTYYADTTADHTLGDLKQVTDASGKVTQFTKYNKHGQVLESTDPTGVPTVNTYDLRQRLLTSTVGAKKTTYAYDAAGQLKRVTDPDDGYVGMDYDDAHRLSAVYDNMGNRIEYTLDNAGNRKVEKIKDPGKLLRKQLQRGINPLGRVEQTKLGQ